MSEQKSGTQLQNLCRKWQKILRLQDYRITVRLGDREEFRGEDVECTGKCRTSPKYKDAVITIRPVDDIPTDATESGDQEVILVHEMLHCFTEQFSKHMSLEEQDRMETMVEMVAQALVQLEKGSRQ